MKKVKSQVFKTVKEGTQSFRITKKLCDSLFTKSNKISTQTELILTIPINDIELYRITCQIKKVSNLKGI